MVKSEKSFTRIHWTINSKIFLKQRNNCQLSNNQWQKHGTWIHLPSPISHCIWLYWIWNFKDSQFTYKVVGKVKIIHVETETSNIQINNDFTYFPNMINMQILIATGNFIKCLQKKLKNFLLILIILLFNLCSILVNLMLIILGWHKSKWIYLEIVFKLVCFCIKVKSALL